MNNAPKPAITSRVNATPEDVYDGDTLVVELVRRVPIRVLGLWAPEVRTKDSEEKKRGLAARDYLRSLIAGATSIVVSVKTDAADSFDDVISFGRPLAELWIDGRNAAELMIEAGHATKNKEG